nr:hypothetical protein BaRGS_029396 [Batillaria attramentaria]
MVTLMTTNTATRTMNRRRSSTADKPTNRNHKQPSMDMGMLTLTDMLTTMGTHTTTGMHTTTGIRTITGIHMGTGTLSRPKRQGRLSSIMEKTTMDTPTHTDTRTSLTATRTSLTATHMNITRTTWV